MPILSNKSLLLCLTAVFLCPAHVRAAGEGPYPGAEPVPELLKPGFENISEARSEEILSVIAGDEFAGRGTGQPGFLKAAAWVAAQLEELGYQPAGPDGSFYQRVPFIRLKVLAEQSTIQVNGEAIASGGDFGVDNSFGSLERGSYPVTLIRMGNEAPDIAEGSLEGRVVILGGPRRLNARNEALLKGKPAAVLVAVNSTRLRSEYVSMRDAQPGPYPVAFISNEIAGKLSKAIEQPEDFFSVTTPLPVLTSPEAMVEVGFAVDRESIDIPNVVAWYPGADPTVADEYVALGAHLDHLGVQNGKVYPGADDNGSGSTALLQVAETIATSDPKPERSILIMFFCAEERGLLGSRYLADNPVKPMEDMVCMLNIDMIGRNEETEKEPASENEDTIHLIASKRLSMDLHEMTMEANEHVKFVFEYDEERVYNRSDHANFAAKGVPVTFLFGGFSPHYHQPSDTLEGINFQKIANVARLNYLVTMMAAEHGHFEKNGTHVQASQN